MYKSIVIFLLLIFIVSCSEDSTVQPNLKPDLKDQPTALIVVTENNLLINPSLNLAYTFIKDDVLNVLSDIFKVEKSNMENMTLAEIIEIYGEDWQNEEIRKVANKYYDEVIILTDAEATGNNLLNNIQIVAGKGMYIDLIFSLHAGSDRYISFSDRRYHINEITNWLKQRNIFIRSLYQTCCYGSYYFNDWKDINTIAINGAFRANDIAIFSPIYFLEEWINGASFNDAVNIAYNRDIEKLKTYNDVLPINDLMLTDEILKNSKQLTSGINDNLKISEYYKEYLNK
jgi:hypothetical protein